MHVRLQVWRTNSYPGQTRTLELVDLDPTPTTVFGPVSAVEPNLALQHWIALYSAARQYLGRQITEDEAVCLAIGDVVDVHTTAVLAPCP